MAKEIFLSQARTDGTKAGVFEFDGDTGYFYLYDLSASAGHKVLDSIHIVSGSCPFTDRDIMVRWDEQGDRVGLFIQGILWAVFSLPQGRKYGGTYQPGGSPDLPAHEMFPLRGPGSG